jgi:hypothetical protein
MANQVGIGFSSRSQSALAGEEAAKSALSKLGGNKPIAAIVHATLKHDAQAISETIRRVVGEIPLYGGSGFGVITSDAVSYGGSEVGVALLSASEGMQLDAFTATGLDKDEYDVGRQLGNQIKGREYRGEPVMVLAYCGVKKTAAGTAPPVITSSSRLLKGMGDALGTWPTVVGGGQMGDWDWTKYTHQWFGSAVDKHSAQALMFSGNVKVDTTVFHGCRPHGDYKKITKAKDNLVLELDGRPALDVVADHLGSAEQIENFPRYVTLGVNRGAKFGEFNEENYANRVVAAVDKETKALVMYDSDLEVGTEVQLMRRDVKFEPMEEKARKMLDQIEKAGRKPFFAYYVDCTGRASPYCQTDGEDAAVIQKVLKDKVPLLGFYGNSEICKIQGTVSVLGWTGVLAIFSR